MYDNKGGVKRVCLLHQAKNRETAKKKKVFSALVGVGGVAEIVTIDTSTLFKRQYKLIPSLENLLLNGYSEKSLVKAGEASIFCFS